MKEYAIDQSRILVRNEINENTTPILYFPMQGTADQILKTTRDDYLQEVSHQYP